MRNEKLSGREPLHQRIPWRRGSGRYVDPRDRSMADDTVGQPDALCEKLSRKFGGEIPLVTQSIVPVNPRGRAGVFN